MKSLKSSQHALAESYYQLQIIERSAEQKPFDSALQGCGLYPLRPVALEIFQVNIGKMCNQTCRHCHVDAGPDRKEIMDRDTMIMCLDIIQQNPSFTTVDITGGAPEMNPNFRWFVGEISRMGRKIIVRCNLTIIVANKKYHDLPAFFAQHRVEVVSSLPFYARDRTDRQRGDGVFDDSIKALQLLNEAGYGIEGTGLLLNLVYNPSGAFLPAAQDSLEKDFKLALMSEFGIHFNHLYTITNMPISRFLDYLIQSGNYDRYMDKLIQSFNPAAAAAVMCRNTLSVGWDGYIYDCDFNQMLDLKVQSSSQHLREFNRDALMQRDVAINQHCYGCTAGSGSSCGGATT